MIRWIKIKIGLLIWRMVVVDASVENLRTMAEMITEEADKKQTEEILNKTTK